MRAVESLTMHFDWILFSKEYKDLDEKIQKSYVSWYWRVMQSLNKNWLLVPNMTWSIWWFLMRAVTSLKICTLLSYFCQYYINFELKNCRRIISHYTLMKNWVFVWKMTWGIWGILTRAVESLKIFTLVGYFCRKYVMFELKKYKGVVSWKVTYGLKRHKKFGEFSQLKSMLDKSSLYNVLIEGMYFFDKSSLSKFNFLNFPFLFWSCPNSSCDFETSSQFLYKLCTIV